MVAAMPYPSGQGTQALVRELASGLSGRGHSVHMICYHHSGLDREDPFPIHRTPTIPIYRRLRSGPDFVKPAIDLMLAIKSVQVIRRYAAQLVHAHNYEGALAGWIAASICGVPLVYHAHNIMEDELPGYFSSGVLESLFRVLGLALDKTVPRLADRVIVLHDALSNALLAHNLSVDKVRVVHPGIDVDFWRCDRVCEGPNFNIIYTGNLDAYQDLRVLFEALPMIVQEVKETRLLLATPNSTRQAESLVKSFGVGAVTDIVFTPSPVETRQAMHRAAVAVVPRSSWSGFPMKNLNAQASGLPVVACRGAAFGVEHEKTGLVVENRDPKALAAALVYLLKNPDRSVELGRNAQRHVLENYGLQKMVKRVEKIWVELVV